MSVKIKTDPQSKDEILGYSVDFASVMDTGETIDSVAITHIPPEGSTMTPLTITGTIVDSIVYFDVGELVDLGLHRVQVLATINSGHKPEIELDIDCLW